MYYEGSLRFFLLTVSFVVNVASFVPTLYEGDVCRNENGIEWKCKKLRDCRSGYEKLGVENPTICSINHFTIYVCCQPPFLNYYNDITSNATTPSVSPEPLPPSLYAPIHFPGPTNANSKPNYQITPVITEEKVGEDTFSPSVNGNVEQSNGMKGPVIEDKNKESPIVVNENLQPTMATSSTEKEYSIPETSPQSSVTNEPAYSVAAVSTGAEESTEGTLLQSNVPTSVTNQPAGSGSNENIFKSKSAEKCKEYHRYIYDKPSSVSLSLPDSEPEEVNTCKDLVSLVVGGQLASPREFPHQVNIGYFRDKEPTKIAWSCTGTLISENFVLSAAHCSTSKRGPPKVAVIGDLDIESNSDEARPERRDIVEIINHPNYALPYNDIALYRLAKNVRLNSFRRPACLYTNYTIPSVQAIASGWGTLWQGGPSSSKLMKVSLNVISYEECIKHWPAQGALSEGINDQLMICAGDLSGIKDTCHGDSGGPLQLKMNECKYSIIGVTSFGRGCGKKIPAIYTRVSNYVPWIESIVWP